MYDSHIAEWILALVTHRPVVHLYRPAGIAWGRARRPLAA